MGTWGTGLYDDDHALDAIADLRESGDPSRHLEAFFADFLDSTQRGFDTSEFAGDWAKVHAVLALCDVVRLAAEPSGARRSSLPVTLVPWLDSASFWPSQSVRSLAADCCRRVSESAWLAADWQEYWQESVAPLAKHYEIPLG